MNKPNIKNCTKQVKEYISDLEREIESLSNTSKLLSGNQEKSRVYQDSDYTNPKNRVKLYLNDRYPVYFKVGDREFQIIINADGNSLHVSCYGTINILPRASNCFDVKQV